MFDTILTEVLKILEALFIALIGIFSTWATVRIERNDKLRHVSEAVKAACSMAQLTAKELQQTVVDDLKAAHEDGKLTREEIAQLNSDLVDKTLEKMSQPTYDLIKAAGIDIEALIKGAGEAWILSYKAADF